MASAPVADPEHRNESSPCALAQLYQVSDVLSRQELAGLSLNPAWQMCGQCNSELRSSTGAIPAAPQVPQSLDTLGSDANQNCANQMAAVGHFMGGKLNISSLTQVTPISPAEQWETECARNRHKIGTKMHLLSQGIRRTKEEFTALQEMEPLLGGVRLSVAKMKQHRAVVQENK